MKCRVILFFLALFVFKEVAWAQVKVEVGELKESRRTDGFFNDLDITLKVSGPALKLAKAGRVTVDKAVDDTGKNLIKEKSDEKDFKEISSFDFGAGDNARLEIALKNSDRKASTVREVSGVIELFVPGRDPQSVIVIPNFQNSIGRMLISPSLRAAGIEVTVWTKDQFDARKKSEEERIKKEIDARSKKAEKSGDLADAAEALGQGLAAIFGSMFDSFAQMEPNDLALNVKDPHSKLVTIEFEDATGKKIEHHGKMTIGGDPRTIIFGFEDKPPQHIRMKVYVLTLKSISKTPFRLTGIQLP